MRIDHGLKLKGDKLIITLPLEDGKKPSEVVVNGKIYAPQEKAQLSEEDATSDSISRQDAIDIIQMNRDEEAKKSLSADAKHKSVIRSKHDAHVAFCDYLIEVVKELPSAEPEVIRCKDCENWDTSWKPTSSSGKSHYCALKDGVWEPNDYCSSAERRGEQE